jgi:hypothetical protein
LEAIEVHALTALPHHSEYHNQASLASEGHFATIVLHHHQDASGHTKIAARLVRFPFPP